MTFDDELEFSAENPPEPSATERAIEIADRYNDVGQHDAAERTLHEALGLEPDRWELHFHLALTMLHQKRWEDAVTASRDAIAHHPDFGYTRRILAAALTNLGRHVEAEQAYLDGLALDPDEPALFEGYALLMHKVGHLDKAEKLARQALTLDPDLDGAHGLLAVILSEAKNTAAAAHHGQHGLSLSPDSDDAHISMGIADLRGGHPFRARRHLREALRLDPDPDTEELYLEADKACRLVYLPMYHWNIVIDRLPGKQFLVWGVFVLSIQVLRSMDVSPIAFNIYVFSYVGFCIYTWFAELLVRGWLKIVPPR